MTTIQPFYDSLYHALLINVDELWLKGKNRPLYYQALRRHAVTIVKNFHSHPYKLTIESQRIVVASDIAFSKSFIEALIKMPGVKNIVLTRKIPQDLTSLLSVVEEELQKTNFSELGIKTFKVETFRVDKRFPKNSMEVSRELGHEILKKYPFLKVDVHHPDLQVEVRILPKAIYLSTFKIKGVGGFPVGTHGKVLSLLSGGIDSPVASHMMMKRGCQVSLCFFYSYPFVGEPVKEKILKLASQLGLSQRCTDLYIVPFGAVQEKITKVARPEYRTVFFRKYMIDIASNLAQKINAQALVTGDSLGQVSSQTLSNLVFLDGQSPDLILRPLIGLNKSEIIEVAKKINTFDISIEPQDDACALFAVKHPVLVPSPDYCRKFLQENDFQLELDSALASCIHYAVTARGEAKQITPSKEHSL